MTFTATREWNAFARQLWHFRPYRLQLGVLMWAWLDIRARDLFLRPIVTPAELPPLPLVFG